MNREQQQRSMQAQNWLNAFVRFVAFLERVGNALGTLAFIWATVVVLGGFISDLVRKDFGFATAIVFLEAFRAFSRQSMPDDQLLFKTTGGIKLKRVSLLSESLYYVNAVIMTLCLCLIPGYLIIDRYIHFLRNYHAFFFLPFLALVSSLRFYHFIMKLSKPKSPKLLQFSPVAALLAVYIVLSLFYSPDTALSWRAYLIIPQWFIIYLLSAVQYPGAARRFRKKLTMAVEVLRVIFLASIILTLSTWWLWLAKTSFSQRVSTWYPLLLLGLLGAPVLGNLQTLVALARILLSCRGLIKRTDLVSNTENTHVLAALRVLYIMVLFQGILYMTACILESCSTLLRRSVALRCGLVDTLGWKSVNLYYQHAYDKFLQESVFDATEINLSTFAVHCLSCNVSRDRKLAALRILDFFLRQDHEALDPKMKLMLTSEITTSTKAVTSLISMLGWTVPKDAETRLLAAKVTAHLAPYLQVVQIPGTMQMVSTLLDEETAGNGVVSTSSRLDIDIVEEDYSSLTRAASMSSKILRLWQHLNILRSIPHDGPKGVDDSLPALGLLILQGLAHNPDNCIEISTATELIAKIIESISYSTNSNTMTPEQKRIVSTASLTLVAKLASVKGKVGVVLRQELCENPFLLSYLTSTLEDSSSGQEQLKPTMDIIAKLAVDRKTRQEIGRIQVIIRKLVQEFRRQDEPSKTLCTATGEALAMLAMECVDNCRAILVQDKPEYSLMVDLRDMLQLDECLYPAASLLQSLCANCGDQLQSRGQSEDYLSSTLKEVLKKIMDARGKQMEALVGLASEICKIMSKRITPVLESCPYVEVFVQKLVCELNANKKPSPEFPSMRRFLVELTICMVESYPSCAKFFRKCDMIDALSEVANNHSKVESYRVFFGSVGVVSEGGLPLSDLVTRAKELVGSRGGPRNLFERGHTI